MKIDAHCHTHCSDGNITIPDRIALIRACGLDAATITDHDFVSAEQVAIAREHCGAMPFIPGIELSLQHQHQVVHLLGYFIDPEDHGLQQHIARVQVFDRGMTEQLAGYYADKYAYVVTLAELKAPALHTFYSMQFIRKAAAELFQNDAQKSFAAYESAATALGMFYADFAPWDVRMGIEIIHAAGGIAVLAHPGGSEEKLMRNLGFLLHDEATIQTYIGWELDGIETGTPVHTPRETAFYSELCARYGLLSTAGSDCHGDDPYLGPAAMGVFTAFADNSYEAMCAAHQNRKG